MFGLAYAVLFTVVGVNTVPRTVGLVVPLLLFMCIGGLRMFARYWLGGMYMSAVQRKSLPQVVIYGAGGAGLQLAAALAQSRDVLVRAFIDDAKHLHGSTLNGIRIQPPGWLRENAAMLGISDVLLAMPSTSRARRAEILHDLLPLHLHAVSYTHLRAHET